MPACAETSRSCSRATVSSICSSRSPTRSRAGGSRRRDAARHAIRDRRQGAAHARRRASHDRHRRREDRRARHGVPGTPPWLGEVAEKLLEDRDGDVRYEAFEALVRIGRDGVAMMWLEEAPEAETRLALMRWSARGRVRACAEALAGASRRLRRLLVESVRTASWKELAPRSATTSRSSACCRGAIRRCSRDAPARADAHDAA